MKKPPRRLTLRAKFSLLVGSVVSVTILVLFTWMLMQSERSIVNQVDAQARALLQQIVLTRQWIADQGGLYVRRTATSDVNPFLQHNDIADTSGLHYVFRNPAMVTRQLSQYTANSGSTRFRITSLKLRNPENAPDAFEREALVQFERMGYEKTRQGISKQDDGSGSPVYRLIIPLRTEDSCMACHRDQGYHVGDVRGGISVIVPMDEAVASIRHTRILLIATGLVIILLVTGLLYVITRRLVLRPIEHLRDVAENSDAGQYDVLARVRTGDELQDLARSLNRMTRRVRSGYEGAVKSLAAAIEARDPYTRGHVDRVSQYTFAIARELGWSQEEQDKWKVGVLLHDVGKIGIRDDVLLKEGKLNDEERAAVQAHPRIGSEIAMASESDLLIHGLPAILYHHERYDGTGYPAGLKGDAIPPIARVLAVADVFDALITDRPYRKAMSHEAAVQLIVGESGAYFDPEVVKAFTAALEKGVLANIEAPKDDSYLERKRT